MIGEKPRILCVSPSSSQHQRLHSALSKTYEPLVASSPDQAVAFYVAAVVLDSEFFSEQGWSVARTFKSINPHLPVVLLHASPTEPLPSAIDAVATSPALLLDKLNLLLNRKY
jgi:DNA-binding NtrC family response regulator